METHEKQISYGSRIVNMYVNTLANIATVVGVNKKIVFVE
jgi:membrane-bound lytic murein transglycosylase B